MGLFDRLRGKKEPVEEKKEPVDWSSAHRATPQFYEKPGVAPFGAIALTEGAETVLPKRPQDRYQVRGLPVTDWRLVLVSTSEGGVVGMVDYTAGLGAVEKYALDTDEESILVRGLTLGELKGLIG